MGSPTVYLPMARYKYGNANSPPTIDPGAGLTVCPETNLVLEGFPRSGNTFACKAFLMAQKSRVNLAHHLHSPAQVIAAGKMGIPALVIVRQPVDAVCSLLLRDKKITPKQALRGWLRFHEKLISYHGNYITATFDQVTTDFGEVIARINTRFRTSFDPFEHSIENRENLFRDIEHEVIEQTGIISESMVSRPSKRRAEEKTDMIELLYHPRIAPHRFRAETLYSRFCRWSEDHIGMPYG